MRDHAHQVDDTKGLDACGLLWFLIFAPLAVFFINIKVNTAKSSGLVGDLRGFKRGHFVQDGAGALQQRPGQHGAGAFAQAQAQIEQRLGVS